MSFGYQVLGFGAFPNRVPPPDFVVTLSSDVNNYNLANDLSNNGSAYGAGNWDGTSAITVVLNINAGVTVYSAKTATPSLTVDLATSSSVLTINNSGSVVGKGGAGGGGTPCERGGHHGSHLRPPRAVAERKLCLAQALSRQR